MVVLLGGHVIRASKHGDSRPSGLCTLRAVEAYTAVVGLATAADAEHAGQRLDYLADYHSAVSWTDLGRAELILTLPAEDAHHAEHQALGLVKAIGHRPTRVEVLLADEHERRNAQ